MNIHYPPATNITGAIQVGILPSPFLSTTDFPRSRAIEHQHHLNLHNAYVDASERLHALKGSNDSFLPSPLQSVGYTPISEIPEVSDYFGINRLLIKDESYNPFGTHKDRKSYYTVQTLSRRRCLPEALCIITAGNAGLSLAAFAAGKQLPVIALANSLAPHVQLKLEQACEQVLHIDLQGRYWSSKELCQIAGASHGRRILDISNLAAPYQKIAHEIAVYEPDTIVLPVGGGELFVGLAAGIRSLRLRTRLIGVTTRQQDTLADKLYAKWTPYRDRVHRLTSGGSSHQLFYLDDESTLGDTLQLVSHFIRCEYSSATAFDILRRASFRATEKVMVLNTGAFRENFQFDTT